MSEKTEQPTHRKLSDARKKGDIPHSKDLSKALLIWGCFGYVMFYGSSIVDSMISMMHWYGENAYAPFSAILGSAIDMAVKQLIAVLTPFCFIVIFIGILAEILQNGLVFAPDKIKLSFNKLNVVGNVKNLFSMRNVVEAIKSMLKVIVLTWVLWRIIQENIGPLMLVAAAGIQAIGTAFGVLLNAMIAATAVIFAIVAGIDMLLQRQLFFRQQKMSKDEVKREYKDMEGDPHIKHQRKSLQREWAMDSSNHAVRSASVVVTNPTHYAVALRYDAVETPLPLVTAKGQGAYAYAMVQTARNAGVPVIEHIYLTRALISDAQLDDYVPTHLLDAVIDVLRTVRDMGSAWD